MEASAWSGDGEAVTIVEKVERIVDKDTTVDGWRTVVVTKAARVSPDSVTGTGMNVVTERVTVELMTWVMISVERMVAVVGLSSDFLSDTTMSLN